MSDNGENLVPNEKKTENTESESEQIRLKKKRNKSCTNLEVEGKEDDNKKSVDLKWESEVHVKVKFRPKHWWKESEELTDDDVTEIFEGLGYDGSKIESASIIYEQSGQYSGVALVVGLKIELQYVANDFLTFPDNFQERS
mmetsp:Transcript_23742/g.42064  ORF Transcript_23742/g.42064 Transcript_23742/m.42064 type:complete len:141 (+) Transcript_23742:102-524(+)